MSTRILVILYFMVIATAANAQAIHLQRIDEPSRMVTLEFSVPLTLLAVWKADCSTCPASLNEAGALAQTYNKKDLQVYGLFSDSWSFYADRAKSQARSNLPQLHDPAFRTMKRFNQDEIPAWLLFSKGGKLIGTAASPSERKSMAAKIGKLIPSKGRK